MAEEAIAEICFSMENAYSLKNKLFLLKGKIYFIITFL